jgi:hypothetical protein
MTSKNEKLIVKSVEVLIAKAADAAELATDQRETADMQHVTAHKLENLSLELAEKAVELAKGLEVSGKTPASHAGTGKPLH